MNCMARLISCNFRTPMNKCFYESKRYLLSAKTLGLDRFIEAKNRMNVTKTEKEKFLKEMDEASDPDNDALIFTSDLKKVVMLVSENELHIITKMLKKLSLQNDTLKFHKYTFGPDIMKLLYLHNKPKEALDLVSNEKTAGHFFQITSFSVLADMLFQNKMYNDVICLYQYFLSRTVVYRNAVQAMLVLYFASCYKLNSESSLEEALSQYEKLDRKGFRVHKRILAFLGMLALNQNKPQIAIESMIFTRPDPVILCIKAMCFAKAKRFDDVLSTLSEAFSGPDDLFITQDTVSYILEEMKGEKENYVEKLNAIINEFQSKSVVSKKSLESLLLAELELQLIYKQRDSKGPRYE